MSAWSILTELVSDYTLRTVAIGAATLGVVSGTLGSFAVLRRQGLLGDAMSHAALPGIALAFLFTHTKAPLPLMIGAALSAWLAALAVMALLRTTRLKVETALGMVLSVFFGIGLLILTFVQRQPLSSQAGLEKFLFGQASTLLQRDVMCMVIVGVLGLVVMLLFWKELKLLTFDPEFAKSVGIPVNRLDVLMTSLLVVAIVVGLQTVGVVLMSAMVVAPAAAARQWTNRLGLLVTLAGLFGVLAGVAGAVASSLVRHLPTGPTIVVILSAIVAISLFFAPRRGLVWNWLHLLHQRRRLQEETVLANLYMLALHHDDRKHPHSQAVLRKLGKEKAATTSMMRQLEKKGLVIRAGKRQWGLTENGIEQAKKVLEQLGAKE